MDHEIMYKSFSDDQLKTEFDKIRAAVAELKSLNIKRSLKRPGADLEQASSKKSKPTEAPQSSILDESQQPSVEVPSQKATKEDVEVPSTTAFTAQPTAQHSRKDGKLQHKLCINLWVLAGIQCPSYRKRPTPRKYAQVIGNPSLVYITSLDIIYGRVMKFYEDEKAAGVGLVLWGDLKVLIDSPEVNDGSDVWKNQHTWIIQSWKLYSYTGIHVLETVSGLVIHMFVDKKYPLSVNLIERMLDHQLEICHDTVGYPKLDGFHLPYSWNEKWLVQEGTALGKDKSNPLMAVMFLHGLSLSGANRLTSPRVNGYLVKAPSNRIHVAVVILLESPLEILVQTHIKFALSGFQYVLIQSSGAFKERSI
ncbi:hypothetical protein Tco_0088393 [Tanacetum coccineum]